MTKLPETPEELDEHGWRMLEWLENEGQIQGVFCKKCRRKWRVCVCGPLSPANTLTVVGPGVAVTIEEEVA